MGYNEGVAPRRSFPLADPLPSTDSAGLRPLFARFPGTMRSSDFPNTYILGVRLAAFPRRSTQGMDEVGISRFGIVLGNPAYRERAGRLRSSIEAADGLNRAADVIEEAFGTGWRPVPSEIGRHARAGSDRLHDLR